MPIKERIYAGLKVLLVEDDLEVAQELEIFLRHRFDQVWVAHSGEGGLEIYRRHKPDMLITDIELPGMDGLRLVETIRREDQKVAIFVITAHVYEVHLLRAVKLNLEEFIPKPIVHSQLLSALKKCAHKLTTQERILGEDLRYSYRNKVAYHHDQPIGLTHMEIELLELLLQQSGQVVTYDQVAAALYPSATMSRDSLRSLVRRLRKKLPQTKIAAVANVGYVLEIGGGV